MNKMKVVLVEPRKKARVVEIDHTLEAMQKTVGGYIETFQLDDEVYIVCNEEGKWAATNRVERSGTKVS